jgi:sugar phosphate permease
MVETPVSDRPRHQGRLRTLRTVALALLVTSGVINYLDRSTLSIANKRIREDLGLSRTQIGVLQSAFTSSYGLAQLPMGAMVDKAGPRLLLAAGMALWSLAQACGGLVSGLRPFIGSRVVLGLGEAPQFPAGARVIGDWYPARDRGLPIGVFNASSSLGPAVAPPLLTALMLAFGWRGMFVIMGLAGLVAALVWYAVYRNPADAGLTAEELSSIREGDAAAAEEVSFARWLRLFRHRTTWGMVLGFAGSLYMIWLYLTWLPDYLQAERGMTELKTGFAASVPFVFGILGSVAGGYLSDRLANRGVTPILSRKLPVIGGLVGMAVFTVPAALTGSATVTLACISLALFCGNVSTANSWGLATVAAPPGYVASLGAIQNFGGYIGGATLAPTVTGFVAQRTGSFAPALIAGAAVAAASAVVYLVLVRDPIPAESLEDSPPAA